MADERIYVIPLKTEVKKAVRQKRANRAVNVIKNYLVKHTKAEKVSVSMKINESLWSKSRQNPPTSIKVRVKVNDGVAVAKAMDEMFIEKAKEESKKEMKEQENKVVSDPPVPDENPAEKKEEPKEPEKKSAKEDEKKEPEVEEKKPMKDKADKNEKTEKPTK